MKYFIVKDNVDSNKYVVIGTKGFTPKYPICPAPKGIKDIGVLDIVDDIDEETGEIIGKKAVFNPEKKEAQNAKLAQQVENQKWVDMRKKRDALLTESDHVMMPDFPMADKNMYKHYRKELRDLPKNIKDINKFSYPTKPK